MSTPSFQPTSSPSGKYVAPSIPEGQSALLITFPPTNQQQSRTENTGINSTLAAENNSMNIYSQAVFFVIVFVALILLGKYFYKR
jgi:hypothetical protein